MEELKNINEIVLNNYIFILLVNSSNLDVNIKENIIKAKYNQDAEFVVLSYSEFSNLLSTAALNNDDRELIITNAMVNSLSDKEISRK